MIPARSDPVIDEVREVRRRISARFDHDPARLAAYYMELQERHRDRLIAPPKAPEQNDGSATQPRQGPRSADYPIDGPKSNAIARGSWSSVHYCVEAARWGIPELARFAYDRVCRTRFDEPGFCLIDLGAGVSSERLRGVMVDLKGEMQAIHRSRSGRDLVYLSVARFDQQVSTKPHRDGGPDECFLMLGYEPSEVRSELTMADYALCAFDIGLAPGEFLERHNPMFAAGEELLRPYETPVACFSNHRAQIVLINNSMKLYSEEEPAWQGVLHTATITNPDEARRRVINSTMIASVSPGTPEVVSEEQREEFLTTRVVRRRGYDKVHLEDDAG